MIKTEFYKVREDGVVLNRTYSDLNFMIQKIGTNEIYNEAVDVYPFKWSYVETTEKIKKTES